VTGILPQCSSNTPHCDFIYQPLRRTERRRPRFVITGIRNGEEFKRITAQPEPRWEQERREATIHSRDGLDLNHG